MLLRDSVQELAADANTLFLTANRLSGREFFQHVSDLYSRFLEGNPKVVAELPTFLRAWLVKHIQGTDRNYVP